MDIIEVEEGQGGFSSYSHAALLGSDILTCDETSYWHLISSAIVMINIYDTVI